ncbi:aminopeptidase N [Rickettsiales bacterium LUAb2]
MQENQIIYRKDYKKPDFLINHTNLYFNIINLETIEVIAKLKIIKNSDSATSLTLNGEDLTTIYVKLNNQELELGKDYSIANNLLTVFKTENQFILETKVVINPSKNTTLMGIYKSQNILCSQCEPEGFRRITWFIDRPDNMSKWDVAIEANKIDFPILLSNGNEVSKVEISDNRILKMFSDPFNKPAYLFAFVAGDFDYIHDTYITTISKKTVDLYIYVDKGKKEEAKFAMESLKKAMLWDEKTYNLEYDLNIFSIVTVRDFNFGAMENKSLNIFNEVYVLAKPETTTDIEFFRTEAVVAHEYFHNWTGDRVTCRDWFQLTLKEGLTVFRDHTFSEDHHYKDCARILESEVVRKKQFIEDNSPLSHPIRPEQYIEMNNFYTSTVYEKGSEVIRMMHTILGENNFKKGIALYFKKFDGNAVTCDDFVASLEEASGVSLTDFKKWYSQSGTPIVTVKTNYDKNNKSFTINLSQINLPTLNQEIKQNLVIPLKTALFDKKGKQLQLHSDEQKLGDETLIILDQANKQVTFNNIKEEPSLSINRFFSAPVIVKYEQSLADLQNLISNDTDGFIKFDSSRKYFNHYILDVINKLDNNQAVDILDEEVSNPFKELLKDNKSNPYLVSMVLKTPDFDTVAALFDKNIPVKNIYTAIDIIKANLAKHLEKLLVKVYNELQDDHSSVSKENYAKRSLKNNVLDYLIKLNKPEYFNLAKSHYHASNNMTNRLSVLMSTTSYIDNPIRQELFNEFLNQYKNESLIVNKWLSAEALSQNYAVLDKVNELINDEAVFSWTTPNKVYALIGALTQSNHFVFHEENGKGYEFLANAIIKLDDINPSVASKMASGFLNINKYPVKNIELMKRSMDKIMQKPNLSKGTFEIINKILNSIK